MSSEADSFIADDSILKLRGLGKELWADEDADAYVTRLRAGWDDRESVAAVPCDV